MAQTLKGEGWWASGETLGDLMPSHVMERVLYGTKPEGHLHPYEGYDAVVHFRYVRFRYLARGVEPPSIAWNPRYMQARRCGWDLADPRFAVRPGQSTKDVDVSQGWGWLWWRGMHWKQRASVVRHMIRHRTLSSRRKFISITRLKI